MSNKLFKENFDKASSLYQLGQYDQSIYYWQQALKQEPENIHVLSLIALINQNFFGKVQEAKSTYERILALDPRNIDALEALAILHYDQEEYQMASDLFLRILSQDSQKTEVYLYLGAIAHHQQELQKALAFYQHVIHRQPKHHQALLAMGDIYSQIDISQAEALYTYILSFNPEDTSTMMRLAKLSIRQHQLDEAEIWLKKAILSDDRSLDCMIELGLLLAKNPARQLDAEYWLHKAYNLDPTNLAGILATAQFYRQNHYEQEAEFYYREALKQDPINFTAFVQLSSLYLEQQRYQESHDILMIASNDYGNQAKIQRLWARVAQAMDNNQEAEAHLLKAIALEPEDLRTIESLARLYLQSHRLNESETLLQQLLSLHPQYQPANHLLSLITLERATKREPATKRS